MNRRRRASDRAVRDELNREKHVHKVINTGLQVRNDGFRLQNRRRRHHRRQILYPFFVCSICAPAGRCQKEKGSVTSSTSRLSFLKVLQE